MYSSPSPALIRKYALPSLTVGGVVGSFCGTTRIGSGSVPDRGAATNTLFNARCFDAPFTGRRWVKDAGSFNCGADTTNVF